MFFRILGVTLRCPAVTAALLLASSASNDAVAQVSPTAAPGTNTTQATDKTRPGQQPAAPTTGAAPVDAKLGDTLWQQLGLRLTETSAKNIIVSDVRPQSPAEKAGLAKGDEVISVAAAPVSSLSRTEHDLLGATDGEGIAIALRRTGTRYDTTVAASRAPGSPGLGDATGQTVTEINVFGMFVHEENQRAIVDVVSPLSPAAKAGVLPGDILMSVAGHPAAPVSALVPFAAEMVNRKQRGAPVALQLLRGGNPLMLQVLGNDAPTTNAVGYSENGSTVDQEVAAATTGLLGLVLRDVSPNTVHVARVAPNSPAAAAGINAGDIISALDRNPLATTEQFVGLIGMRQMGDKVELIVGRQGRSFPTTMMLTPRLQDAAQASVGISTTMMRGEINLLEQRVQMLSDEIQAIGQQRAAAQVSAAGPATQTAPAQVK